MRTPVGSIVRGAIAGAVGTLAMDLVWYSRYKRGGGKDRFADWEFSVGTEGYEQAAAPAQVGKRIVEGVTGKELPDSTAAFMNNAVHWATGAGWGKLHGLIAGSAAAPSIAYGLVTGPVAWATSYAALAPMGIYKPMWEYDAATLWKDLSAHLVYGLGTAAAFKLLSKI